MKYFEKLPFCYNVTAMREALTAHPELWDAEPSRREPPGSPHREMTDIWLRYNDITPFHARGDYAGFNDEHIPVWYPAWTQHADIRAAFAPIIFHLMAAVQGEMLGGILITRIPAGKRIYAHTDAGWHVDYYDKFYVSIESSTGAIFWCEDESINPTPGDVYRFDNRNVHGVENNSTGDRITLIICIRTSQWTK